MGHAPAASAPDTTALGFESPSTTAAPDTLFDYWLSRVPGAQLRVLLFLNRRCYGPDGHVTHEAVAVSAKHLLHGGCFPNGRRFDGCGIRNKTTLQKAVAGLEALGLVRKVKTTAPRGGDGANVYQFCVRDHPETPSAAGFRPLNTTPVPNELYDYWLARLSDAELRALLYIVRHTLGWRKGRDVISPQQFIVGIRARDSRIVDEGCGLKTEKHLYLALAALETYHLIQRTRRWRPDGGYGTTAYSLRFAGDLPHVLRPSARATPEELQSDTASADAHVEPFNRAGSRPLDRVEEPDRGGAGAFGGGVQSRPDMGYGQDRIEDPVETGYRGQSRPGRESDHDPKGSTATTGQQETWSQEKGSQEIQHHQRAWRWRLPSRGMGRVGGGDGHNEKKAAKDTPARPSTPSPPVRDGFAADSRQACAMDETGQREGRHANPTPIILATEEEIRSYVLADDEVLIDAGEGGAQVMPLRDVVCNDILATQDSYVPVWSEVYYSIEHFLGEGGDEWTRDEERRIERQKALCAELDALYKDIGAFSLEEALGHYFTADLIQRFASSDPSERQRVLGWLRYVDGDTGASLTNPAGFLRTRLESGQWAPRGVTSVSGRDGRRRL